jgi:uncharacterized membrane protein
MKAKPVPLMIASAFGVGALTMYFADPDHGKRRRALVRDTSVHSAHQLRRFARNLRTDVENRVRGTLAEHRQDFAQEPVGDSVLKQRILTALGRVLSRPRAVQVSCTRGSVYLAGWVFANEVDDLNQTVKSIPGVKEVLTFVNTSDHPERIPALQGAHPRRAMPAFLQDRWSPTLRALAGCAGAALVLYGTIHRRSVGKWAAINGAILLGRSILNTSLERIVGTDQTIGVHVQKTISVNASPAELYEFWGNPENYPKVFGHVNRVTVENGGLFHWEVPGPAGVPLSWTGRITKELPERLVEWASTPESIIANHGSVHLEPEKGGRTRVHVQMSYKPPAGFLGHAVASLLGLDPKSVMDEDFVRLKTLFELGKTRAHGHVVKKAEFRTPTGSERAHVT